MQVEDDAKMLRKTTEQLNERTEALKQELATQKEEFSQRLFEAQQENNQVYTMCWFNNFDFAFGRRETQIMLAAVSAKF